MRFDWYQYLIAAWELLGRRNQHARRETKQRIAISRAYYAAFIIARNYLHDIEGVDVPYRDVHQFVIDYYRDSRDPRRRKIARLLREMRHARTRADYDDVYADLYQDSFKIPQLSAEAIGLVGQL